LFQLVLLIASIATLFYLIGRHTGKRKCLIYTLNLMLKEFLMIL